MTTLEGKDKSIRLTFSNNITILSSNNYQLNLPTISCTKLEDAELMQTKINEFVNNLSREFIEEIGCYISWDKIKYRYCGRYYSDVEYSKHFKCYQLQLFDIVELLPSEAQLLDLEKKFSSFLNYLHSFDINIYH